MLNRATELVADPAGRGSSPLVQADRRPKRWPCRMGGASAPPSDGGSACRSQAASGRPLIPWAITLSSTVRTIGRQHGLHPGIVDGELLDDQEPEHHRGETPWTEPPDEERGRASEPRTDHADRHRDHPHDREAEDGVQGDAPVHELQSIEQEARAEHEPDGQRQDPPDQLGELGGLFVVLADAGPEARSRRRRRPRSS